MVVLRRQPMVVLRRQPMVVYPSFPHFPVIPAKAGIQGWWRGATAAFPRSTPPGFPLSRE